jgi:hypothetical protein
LLSGAASGAQTSGSSQPQLQISKEGDRYLRTLLVQGAHYILGPFGQDSDLRRWGLKLAERGGSNAKKYDNGSGITPGVHYCTDEICPEAHHEAYS